MTDWLVDPLTHRFMQHAFIAIVLVGVICGVTGVFVTLRGLAFMGDALAHAIFPGVVIAFLLGGSFLIGALVAAVLVSLGIGAVSQNARLKGDTAIGVLFAGGFALGIALISAQRSYTRDLATFLIGSILGVSQEDLLLTAGVGIIVLGAIGLFRRELTIVAFDRTYASATGLNLWRYDQLFLVLLSLAIVISLQTVGNVLVLAMLVTPAATARLLTDRLANHGSAFGRDRRAFRHRRALCLLPPRHCIRRQRRPRRDRPLHNRIPLCPQLRHRHCRHPSPPSLPPPGT